MPATYSPADARHASRISPSPPPHPRPQRSAPQRCSAPQSCPSSPPQSHFSDWTGHPPAAPSFVANTREDGPALRADPNPPRPSDNAPLRFAAENPALTGRCTTTLDQPKELSRGNDDQHDDERHRRKAADDRHHGGGSANCPRARRSISHASSASIGPNCSPG